MKTRRIVISTVLLVGGLLSIVQVMPKNPLLIGERLFPYGGWIQVILAMLYGGWLCYKMQDRQDFHWNGPGHGTPIRSTRAGWAMAYTAAMTARWKVSRTRA